MWMGLWHHGFIVTSREFEEEIMYRQADRDSQPYHHVDHCVVG